MTGGFCLVECGQRKDIPVTYHYLHPEAFMRQVRCVCLWFTFVLAPAFLYAMVPIIPQPEKVVTKPGSFALDGRTPIVVSSEKLDGVARYLAEALRGATGAETSIEHAAKGRPNTITLTLIDRPSLGSEGYELLIGPHQVHIVAADPHGAFYGAQSLLQLIPPDRRLAASMEGGSIALPCLEIVDKPAYGYRGGMVDVSRHFFTKDVIKQYIDLLARYKINTFHWHLNDDQGWRIESKRFPKLNSIGSWREEDGKTYGGYYTQAEIAEVLAYAAERYVTVLPEIEMPGHCTAALASYPDTSCTGGPFTIPSVGGVYPNTYCPCKKETYAFLESLLEEMIGIFPSGSMHLGGDEVITTTWSYCLPNGAAPTKLQGSAMQGKFMRRMAAFVRGKGKEVIGWDGMLTGGPPPHSTIMAWQSEQIGVEAIKLGLDVIMAPDDHCYFDAYQTNPAYEPPAQPTILTLGRAYQFDATPSGLTAHQQKKIRGGEGALWTEYIYTPDQLMNMAFPRMIAFAETVWSPRSTRAWDDFNSRLQPQLALLREQHVNYSEGSFHIEAMPQKSETGSVLMGLDSEQYQPTIYYTTDSSNPTTTSNLYTKPFPLPGDADGHSVITAAIFRDAKPVEGTTTIDFYNSLALNAPYTLSAQPGVLPPYGSVMKLLTDGTRGTTNYFNGGWVAFNSTNMDLTVDLGATRTVRSITSGFLQILLGQSYSYLPTNVNFSVSSDGKTFTQVAALTGPAPQADLVTSIKNVTATFEATQARYVKVNAVIDSIANLPQGRSVWMCVDEILVK